MSNTEAINAVASPVISPESAWPGATQAWYAVIVLTIANSFAFVDRQALALLLQPIKDDMQVSDTIMSLLYGFSFSLFYVSLGIPIARFADRLNRRNIIAASIFVWSLMTASCGLARSFGALFLSRIGVGAGEAGLNPAANSMIADLFPKERLAAALGVYSTGVYIGGGLALILGGLAAGTLSHMPPIVLPVIGLVKTWQMVFLMLGIPGILLAALTLTMREPERRSVSGVRVKSAMPLSAVFAQLRRHKWAYLGIMLGMALMILVGNGAVAWIPAFLTRKFGWGTEQVGAQYGFIVIFCGISGALSGGFIASYLKRRGIRRANLFTALAGFVALVPVTIAFPLVPSAQTALILIGVMNFFAAFNFGGGLAALQEITPNGMRAVTASIYSLAANLIGAGVGPLMVALFTDRWFGDPSKLPEALALTATLMSPLAVLMMWLGLRHYQRALDDVQRQVPL